MFAILLAALAPSVSHALAAAKGGTWTEICSVTGVKLVKAGQGAPDHGKHAAGFEHCPFCSAHGNSPTLPSSTELILGATDGRVSHPSLFYQSPRPLFVWASLQSRAPPFHS